MNEAFEEKRIAVAALRQFILKIEHEQREPDLWERFYFQKGLELLASGSYRRVEVEVEYALEPQPKRRADLQPEADPKLERLGLAMMLRELAAASLLSPGQ